MTNPPQYDNQGNPVPHPYPSQPSQPPYPQTPTTPYPPQYDAQGKASPYPPQYTPVPQPGVQAPAAVITKQRFVIRDDQGYVRLTTAEGISTDDAQTSANKEKLALEIQQPDRTYTVEPFKA